MKVLAHARRTIRIGIVARFGLHILIPALPGCFALSHLNRFRRPGGYGGEPPPDPISNSVVKVPSADGTTS